MAKRRDSFDDLNNSMGKLGISNGDDKKKKINNEDDDWSMGTKVALGVGAGLALGAGIAALSYFLGGSDDEKEEETKKLPERSHRYVAADLDDNDHGDHTVQFLSPRGGLDSAQVSRRYGYFQCSNCRHHWESANTFPKGPRLNEWFTQDCERCGTANKPYRSEPILCQYCRIKECVCDKDTRRGRHNDPRKPHHHDRCERCRMGFPCADASE